MNEINPDVIEQIQLDLKNKGEQLKGEIKFSGSINNTNTNTDNPNNSVDTGYQGKSEINKEEKVTNDNKDNEDTDVFDESDIDDAFEIPVISPNMEEDVLKTLPTEVSQPQLPKQNVDIDSLEKVDEYVKKLMTEFGFSLDDAQNAALKHFGMTGTRGSSSQVNPNNPKDPDAVILTIDKSQEEELQLTENEKQIIQKASVVAVNVVETHDVEAFMAKKKIIPNTKNRTTLLREIESHLTQYGFVMPATGEFLTFRGVPIKELGSAVIGSKESELKKLQKQVNLVYNALLSSETKYFCKRDSKNNITLSLDEFIERFKFVDLPLALHAINCATSPERVTLPGVPCRSCNQNNDIEVNVKELLDIESLPEAVINRMNLITNSRGNSLALEELVENCNNSIVYQSPLTDHLYGIRAASLSRVAQILSLKENMELENYEVELLYYLHTLYIPKGDELIVWGEDTDLEIIKQKNPMDKRLLDYNPIEDLISIIRRLSNKELSLIKKIGEDFFYETAFSIKSICPKCGGKNIYNTNITDMVFTIAAYLETINY